MTDLQNIAWQIERAITLGENIRRQPSATEGIIHEFLKNAPQLNE